MKVGERIKGLREDKDLYQKDIAKILQTTQSYYAQYENSRRKLPIDQLIKLCLYHNVSADYILGLIDYPRPLKQEKNIS